MRSGTVLSAPAGAILVCCAAICGVAHAAAPSAAQTTTLAEVRAAGVLRCGIDVSEAEYSSSDDHGNRAAFDADLCRTVAVAVLGKDARVAVVRYPDDRTGMDGLIAGKVDMIASLSDDFTHSANAGIVFSRPVLWDGVGLLVQDQSGITEARQLSGKKVCFLAETAVEESVRAWFAREHLDFVPFPFQEEGEMEAAFATGNCTALAGDRTRLAETRMIQARNGHRERLLPEVISADPLAATVRAGDPQWAAIVNWVMEALVQAEESGVMQANVAAQRARAIAAQSGKLQSGEFLSGDPEVRFLLGASHQIGPALGLDNDWAVRVIAATGNYGEIYRRDLGEGSPLKLPRAENDLHSQGGRMAALPFK